MISHNDNCLFIHIPKAAGQSVESIFLQQNNLTWDEREQLLLKPNSDPQKGPPRLAHLTADEYLSLGYLAPDKFNALFKFTIVRNPWDRLVSEYLYKKHSFCFKDFIFKYFPEKDVDDYKQHNGLYRHVMPQHQFIYGKENKCLVDYVGKFETLQQDFSIISQKIFGKPLVLPHKNKTQQQSVLSRSLNKLKKSMTGTQNKKHYSSFYDDETQEWVAKFYAKDIELFGYHFELQAIHKK